MDVLNSATLLSRRNAEQKKSYQPALSTHIMLSHFFYSFDFLTAVENVPPLIDGFQQISRSPWKPIPFYPACGILNTLCCLSLFYSLLLIARF